MLTKLCSRMPKRSGNLPSRVAMSEMMVLSKFRLVAMTAYIIKAVMGPKNARWVQLEWQPNRGNRVANKNCCVCDKVCDTFEPIPQHVCYKTALRGDLESELTLKSFKRSVPPTNMRYMCKMH